MVFDAAHGSTVMFGGSFQPCCDTWSFDGYDWTQLRPSDQPPPRSLHAMAYDSQRARVVVFGGVGTNGFLNDTWEWDGRLWIRQVPANSPSPRAHHAMVYDEMRGVSVLFGGVANGVNLGDTWTWDGTNWVDMAASGGPAPRFDHAMAYDTRRQRTVLFGGQTDCATCSQTWEWDGAGWWPQTPVMTPPGRLEHAMTYDLGRGVTVMFGGRGQAGVLGDTWEWTGMNWIQVHPAVAPAPRASHRLVYDEAVHQVVAFGGISASATPFDDTWAYSPLPFPATHEMIGHGCIGSDGQTPRLDLLPGGLPWIGETFGLQLDRMPPLTAALLMFGVSDQRQGLLLLPAELSSFGMPGCWLYTSIDMFLPINTGDGSAQSYLDLPTSQNLLGFHIYHQAMVLDPQANSRGFTTSNAGVAVIGARL